MHRTPTQQKSTDNAVSPDYMQLLKYTKQPNRPTDNVQIDQACYEYCRVLLLPPKIFYPPNKALLSEGCQKYFVDRTLTVLLEMTDVVNMR